MNIAVVDGQGGGVGKSLVAGLREHFKDKINIIALGTNSMATSTMMKAGADQGATGENAIVYNAGRVDMIAGPIGIILANSMLGEVSPSIAEALGSSDAQKFLIPVRKCQTNIAGSSEMPMKALIEDLIIQIATYIQNNNL